MGRVLLIIATAVLSILAPSASTLAADDCPPAPPPAWTDLVDRTDDLLQETRLVFAQGALAYSPVNAESNRELAFRWIDLGKEWSEVEAPEGREVIAFTANRMAGHLTTILTQFIRGETDAVQLGKTSEAIDAFVTAESLFIILNLGCDSSITH